MSDVLGLGWDRAAWTEETPSGCDVVGCDKSATGSYVEASDSGLLEFSICHGHYARLQAGARPVVVADRFGLCDVDGRPVLLLE